MTLDPTGMSRVIGGKRYRVATSTLLADDRYWDGNNYERHNRNQFLYRTPNGAYFVVRLTQWEGEQNKLEVISQAEAIALYEGELSEHYVPYEEAFPGTEVTDG